MAEAKAPVRVVHGYSLPATEARDFAKRLWHMAPAKLAALPGVPADAPIPSLRLRSCSTACSSI